MSYKPNSSELISYQNPISKLSSWDIEAAKIMLYMLEFGSMRVFDFYWNYFG